MKFFYIAVTLISLAVPSCKTVGSAIHSTTYIEPGNTFVLGDNEHEAYEVTVQKNSKDDLELSQMAQGGTKQIIQKITSDEPVTIVVNKNTALYIDNKSENKATVELNIKSNVNLTMGYKK